MKKRIITMCLMALMMAMLVPVVQAEYVPEKVVTVTDLGNGITIESTITVHESLSAFSTMATKKPLSRMFTRSDIEVEGAERG